MLPRVIGESAFRRDDKWQREMRDRILAPGFYKKYSVEGRYVFVDKGNLATLLQKQLAVDTILQGKHGNAVCIEEKIVRWPNDDGEPRDYPHRSFAFETMCDLLRTPPLPGWMHYGRADYLFYCFSDRCERSLDCYLIDFQALRHWFWQHEHTWYLWTSKDLPRSQCRLVPIWQVRRALPTWRYPVAGPGVPVQLEMQL